MSRNFGKKIMIMVALSALMLMASISSAFAVVEEYNGLGVIGYQTIKADPAPDAQYIRAQSTYDVAAVDVVVQDFGPCVAGVIAVDLNIHNGPISGPVVAVATVNVPRCFAGVVRFNFPAVGPMFNAGYLYTLDLNTLTPGTELSWAYTNNVFAPGVGLSLWDNVAMPNDYKFVIFS